MTLNLGELAGIISLDEKPAMVALEKARRGMKQTAAEGQKTSDKLQAQQTQYSDAVEKASEKVAKSKRLEVEASNSVQVAEKRLAAIRKNEASATEKAAKAQEQLLASRKKLTAANEKASQASAALNLAQERLAVGVAKMRAEVQKYSEAATASSVRAAKAQETEKKASTELWKAQLALGNLRKTTPKDMDAIAAAQERLIKVQERLARAEAATVRANASSTAAQSKLVSSVEKMRVETQRYEFAVSAASANVAKAKQREIDANAALTLGQEKLANIRDAGADSAARVEAAEQSIVVAQARVVDSQKDSVRSSHELEQAQSALADSADRDSRRMGSVWANAVERMRGNNKNISVDFHKMANSLSWDGTRTGRLVARSFAIMAVGATSVLPAVGALGAGVVAASGSVLTLSGSIKQLGGVAALAPAGLFALGSGVAVLMSAFSGMGEALKTATEETGATASNAKLDAMTLADAARAVARAERTSAEQRVAAVRKVSDAQEQAAEANQAASERVTEAEERAAEARAAALARVESAQRDLVRVIEQNAEQQASALKRVEDASDGVEQANKRVLNSERDLSVARKEASAQLAELQTSLESASLSERAAVLNFNEAKQALERGISAGVSGTTREMQERQLAFDQADFALREARKRTQSLREEEAVAAKAGVEGSGRVLDAQEQLREAREAQLEAIGDQRRASAEADKVQRENAVRLADAQGQVADASKDAAQAQRDGIKDVADARKDAARVERDSARSVADAVEDAARSQRDSVESVEDAYRNLERTQIQQADAQAKLTEKSVEAMEKLTPAGQAMAAALLIAYGRLGDVRDIAQENFFAGMDAPLLALVDTVIPQLERGVGRLATAYGAGAQTIIRALDRELGNGVLERMFDRSTEAAYILNDAIDPIISALVTLTDVGMEYMPRLAGGIRDAAGEFDAFIEQAATDGSLDMWIENGIEGTKDLFSILGSVLGILDKLEDAARAGGIATTLGSVADGLDRIEESVSGPTFQTTMSTIFAGAKGGAEGLLAALGPIGEAFRVGGPALAEFLRLGGEIAGTFVGSMFTGLSDPNFGAGLTTFLEHVQDGVDELGPLLPGLFSALGDMLVAVGPVVEAFGPTAVQVLTIFAEGLGGIMEFMEPLLTGFASSPAAVATFAGVIAGTAVLGAMATFLGNIVGITSAFKLMWVAATGPVGLFVLALAGVGTAFTWFVTDTELGRESLATFTDQMDTAQGKTDEFTGNLMEQIGRSMGDFRDQMGTAQAKTDTFTNSLIEDFNGAQSNVDSFTNRVIAKFGEFKGGMDSAQTKVDSFTGGIKGFFEDMGKTIKTVMDNVPGYFDAAKTGAMTAWNLLKNEAKKPISFIFDTVINGGLIAGFNSILEKVKAPTIPPLKKPKGFRDGGYTGNGGVDEAAGIVHGKEYVFTAAQTAAIGKENLASAAHAAVRGDKQGAASSLNMPNQPAFFHGNASAVARHKALYMSVAPGMGPWNFAGGARMWDGAAGVKVKVGRGQHQGYATPLERGGGILGYTTGTNIDMSPSWMTQLSAANRTKTAAHEFGHALGLPHFTGVNSIMHPNLGNQAMVPTPYDIRALQTLFPGGSGKAGAGGGGGDVDNPFDGMVDKLMARFEKQFPKDGLLNDTVGAISKNGLLEAVKWVSKIKDTATTAGGIGVDVLKDRAGDIAGDVVKNIRNFFGGGSSTATLMDGGGWLRDTDGPTVIHQKKKPDAFTPYDEWQQMKRDYQGAQGVTINSTTQYVGPNVEEFADRERRRMQDAFDSVGP